jgi:EAL domain-containing protein (putative c-di-GMP-specific phosphodiesterase class I)
MAMYSAKEGGRHSYRYYSHDMNVRAMERLAIESRMRAAIDNEEFELHFQPKVSLRDGRITGAEALLRWKYADEKSIETQRFVAVAEETGLIQPLGEWVLRTACRQGRAWSGPGAPRIAVNCSVRQFGHTLIDSVQEAIRSSGLDPQRLEIEITESLLMSNVEQNIRILQRLSELGVQVAIDDFGTGFSSLGYLRRLKINTIKIDRTFVQDIATRQDDVAIVRAIIALAHSLRMNVVAEGVETEAQRDVLRSLDCDEGQGHLFSPAVSAAEFAQALAPERARAHVN